MGEDGLIDPDVFFSSNFIINFDEIRFGRLFCVV